MKIERARVNKASKLNKNYKIEKKKENCEHEWALKLYAKNTGHSEFLGRTLVCTKCKKSLSSRLAGDSVEFNKVIKRFS